MAASLSTVIDVHLTIPQADTKGPIFLAKPVKLNPTKRTLLSVSCSSSKSPTTPAQEEDTSESAPPRKSTAFPELSKKKKKPSLSNQLKPLVSGSLSSPKDQQAQLLSKPKSTWVNPTKPKRSVLSLQRQKKAASFYNPKFRELTLFTAKLNECPSEESAFLSVLGALPHQLTRDDALLILKGLKPWERPYLFLNWIKMQNLFPIDNVFYNVTMKALRYGKQFELIEELANEMISTGVELDNITYSTIITCATKRELFDKAVEWFERMYKTGLMPDEVTYCTVLHVYAKLVKVEDALSLYDRGVASGWKPDVIAYSVMARMFGDAGDYDGIKFVLQEMNYMGVKPNLTLYNALLEAIGKAGRPGHAKRLFEEMIEAGLTPNAKTLTALAKIYGKVGWHKSVMELRERMKSNNWPVDFLLKTTLVSVCADLGLVDEAERLFDDLKGSEHVNPDSYSAMLKAYGHAGNDVKAMELFEEVSERGIKLNVMGYTSLIRSLGKAQRADDLVRVFDAAIGSGIRPDDRLNGCLLSILSLCDVSEEADKVLSCLQKSNPKVVALIKSMEDVRTSFETIKEEFRVIMSGTVVEARRPICNCLIDICRNKNLHGRAHELLYLGTLYGLYPDLHNKTGEEWTLDVRSLSVGAALTALEEWMGTLTKFVRRNEALPELFSAHTGAGTHKFSHGLGNAFASHVEKLAAPFKLSEEKAGVFLATRDDLVTWIISTSPSNTTA